jgi:hypothetical protein
MHLLKCVAVQRQIMACLNLRGNYVMLKEIETCLLAVSWFTITVLAAPNDRVEVGGQSCLKSRRVKLIV